ncbi:MAG: hypothetical protein WDW38_005450 [Sanguina aurantia]
MLVRLLYSQHVVFPRPPLPPYLVPLCLAPTLTHPLPRSTSPFSSSGRPILFLSALPTPTSTGSSPTSDPTSLLGSLTKGASYLSQLTVSAGRNTALLTARAANGIAALTVSGVSQAGTLTLNAGKGFRALMGTAPTQDPRRVNPWATAPSDDDFSTRPHPLHSLRSLSGSYLRPSKSALGMVGGGNKRQRSREVLIVPRLLQAPLRWSRALSHALLGGCAGPAHRVSRSKRISKGGAAHSPLRRSDGKVRGARQILVNSTPGKKESSLYVTLLVGTLHLETQRPHALTSFLTRLVPHLPPPTSHLPPPTSHLPPPTSHLPPASPIPKAQLDLHALLVTELRSPLESFLPLHQMDEDTHLPEPGSYGELALSAWVAGGAVPGPALLRSPCRQSSVHPACVSGHQHSRSAIATGSPTVEHRRFLPNATFENCAFPHTPSACQHAPSACQHPPTRKPHTAGSQVVALLGLSAEKLVAASALSKSATTKRASASRLRALLRSRLSNPDKRHLTGSSAPAGQKLGGALSPAPTPFDADDPSNPDPGSLAASSLDDDDGGTSSGGGGFSSGGDDATNGGPNESEQGASVVEDSLSAVTGEQGPGSGPGTYYYIKVSLGKHSHKSRMRWLPLGEEVLDRVPVSGCDFVFTVVRPIVNATLHLALYATHTSRKRGKVVGRLLVPLSELMEEGRSGSVTDAKGVAQGALWSFEDMELGVSMAMAGRSGIGEGRGSGHTRGEVGGRGGVVRRLTVGLPTTLVSHRTMEAALRAAGAGVEVTQMFSRLACPTRQQQQQQQQHCCTSTLHPFPSFHHSHLFYHHLPPPCAVPTHTNNPSWPAPNDGSGGPNHHSQLHPRPVLLQQLPESTASCHTDLQRSGGSAELPPPRTIAHARHPACLHTRGVEFHDWKGPAALPSKQPSLSTFGGGTFLAQEQLPAGDRGDGADAPPERPRPVGSLTIHIQSVNTSGHLDGTHFCVMRCGPHWLRTKDRAASEPAALDWTVTLPLYTPSQVLVVGVFKTTTNRIWSDTVLVGKARLKLSTVRSFKRGWTTITLQALQTDGAPAQAAAPAASSSATLTAAAAAAAAAATASAAPATAQAAAATATATAAPPAEAAAAAAAAARTGSSTCVHLISAAGVSAAAGGTREGSGAPIVAVIQVKTHYASVAALLKAYVATAFPADFYDMDATGSQLTALQAQQQEEVTSWLSSANPPLPPAVSSALMEDTRSKFEYSRIKLNLQRISTSLKMLTALGSWVGVVTSWEHPQASLEVAGLIPLLCYSPSLAMQVFLWLLVLASYRQYLAGKATHAQLLSGVAAGVEGSSLAVVVMKNEEGEAVQQEADIPLNSFAELRRKYDNLIEMALKAQNLFDNIASVLERFQALLSWRDSFASWIFLGTCAAAAMAIHIVGLSTVICIALMWQIRPPMLRDPLTPAPVNFFNHLPSQSDQAI